jgi:hypothetical protein
MYANKDVNDHNTVIFNHTTTILSQIASDVVIGDIPDSVKGKIRDQGPS